MTLKHKGVFGAVGSGKTHYVKSELDKLIKEGKEVKVFDWVNEYKEFESEKGKTKNMLRKPKYVTDTIWAKALAETFAYHLCLGERGHYKLMDIINKLLKDKDINGDKKPFEIKDLLKASTFHYKEKINELEQKGMRMPFAEQETYLNIEERLEMLSKDIRFNSVIKTNPKNQVMNTSKLTNEMRGILISLELIREFLVRRMAEDNEPIVFVVEGAHHLFPRELKRDPLFQHESLIEGIIREGRHYEMYVWFVTSRESDLPGSIVYNVEKSVWS